MYFLHRASAANATITLQSGGAMTFGTPELATDLATAADATIRVMGGILNNPPGVPAGGRLTFHPGSSAGNATISLTVDSASKSRDVTFGASPVTLSVSDGDNGAKICTVQVNDVDDLYQAAFRINFSSAWEPVLAEAGPFLGGEDDILFFDMTNQTGFVPVAVTRKGNVTGVDGSGSQYKPASRRRARKLRSERPPGCGG